MSKYFSENSADVSTRPNVITIAGALIIGILIWL